MQTQINEIVLAWGGIPAWEPRPTQPELVIGSIIAVAIVLFFTALFLIGWKAVPDDK